MKLNDDLAEIDFQNFSMGEKNKINLDVKELDDYRFNNVIRFWIRNNNFRMPSSDQLISIYKNVFLYVFGETIVFSDLSSARDQIGIKRAVTLEGELLEKSGAMTGGSLNNRALGLSFGRLKDNDDCDLLKNRL